MILPKCCVFSRMSPFHKAQLVECFQNMMQYTVCMCGDGANDCGALITADAGLSLSEAEASVAAHFTSKVPNITAVHHLLREGRCCLTSSAQLFKYMACYSIIQFTTVLILYTAGTTLGDFQFLWIDLFLIIPLAFLLGLTKPKPQLSIARPIASLLSPTVITSLAVIIVLHVGLQGGMFVLLKGQSWYQPIDKQPDYSPDDPGNERCQESTTMFLFSVFQYISSILVFSIDEHFRLPLYKNVPLLIALCVLIPINIYIVLFPAGWIMSVMVLVDLPMNFKAYILGMAAANLLVVWIFEKFLVVRELQKYEK